MTKHDDRPCTCRSGPVWNCPRHTDHDHERSWKPKRIDRSKRQIAGLSVAQQVRTAFLNGIRAERARAQYENKGWVFCERCGKSAEGLNLDDAIKWAMTQLDAAHVVKRARGARYKGPTRQGVDAPTNVALLCRKCHEETE